MHVNVIYTLGLTIIMNAMSQNTAVGCLSSDPVILAGERARVKVHAAGEYARVKAHKK